MENIAKQWFTIEEAARYLCCARSTLEHKMAKGHIKYHRIKGQQRGRRLLKADLDDTLEEVILSVN